ncbi:flagellar motor protein MotB [Roseomonas xinghualingensis]|uniref:flagellar motor protein MotB n=1 Tax=Roseomonas xinghualingensis TaxID=2986475 RepID=UPI0021F22523|nr:flagellar motor protein MotB [Roseomonas sp. SXEYE001]MCV4209005.1 OmpA family protein [Roseomonas sp. SXEYE001]
MAKGRGAGATIIIRREEGGEGGHHGGAWKVAYADFVTAMMAFFLLMWLLNATTEDQRRGLADYFNPTNIMGRGTTGSGQPFGGRTPNEVGELSSNASTVRLETGPRPLILDIEEDDSDTPATPLERREGPKGDDETATPARLMASRTEHPSEAQNADLARASAEALREELRQRERAALDGLAEQIRAAVREDPTLADLSNQLQVEQVPEGLRIQLLDAERQPMFALGGSTPGDKAQALLAKVAAVINRVPNDVAISGHTDATPFRPGARSNWDLSAERANATRRLLAEGGVVESRIRSVAGLAAREPLLPGDPQNPANRRVSILLLREAPPATGKDAS